jgi:hypothetical protein
VRILDRRSKAMLMEFVQQAGEGRPFHVVLVERLDRGEPRGGP